MIQRPLLMGLAASAVCLVLLPTQASALEPDTATSITSTTFTSLPFRYSLDEEEAYMGIEDCKSSVESAQITVSYDSSIDLTQDTGLAGTYYYSGAYHFSVDVSSGTAVNCSTDSVCATVDTDDVSRQTDGADISIDFDELSGISTQDECETASTEQELFIRLEVTDGTTYDAADAKITLDLIAPEVPESFTAVATEDTIQVNWVDGSSGDIAAYRVVYSTTEFSAGKTPEELQDADSTLDVRLLSDSDSDSGSFAAELEAGAQLYIGLATVDEAGNSSAVIGPLTVEVVDTVDFWEFYKGQGGSEEGGYCATGRAGRPAGAPALVVLAGLLLLGVRRRVRDSRTF